MPTNLAIDDKLIEQAKRLGKHRTKKDAVNAALAAYIRKFKQTQFLDLLGTVEYEDDYDYKKQRKKK